MMPNYTYLNIPNNISIEYLYTTCISINNDRFNGAFGIIHEGKSIHFSFHDDIYFGIYGTDDGMYVPYIFTDIFSLWIRYTILYEFQNRLNLKLTDDGIDGILTVPNYQSYYNYVFRRFSLTLISLAQHNNIPTELKVKLNINSIKKHYIMNRAKSLFRKIFLVKEIVSQAGIVHFQRWRILNLGIFAIYIHKIYQRDKDKHLHNHPWNYINIILKGGYVEAQQIDDKITYNEMISYRYSVRNRLSYHKIHQIIQPVTTLFITGRRHDNWGYNVDGVYIDHKLYRENKRKGFYG